MRSRKLRRFTKTFFGIFTGIVVVLTLTLFVFLGDLFYIFTADANRFVIAALQQLNLNVVPLNNPNQEKKSDGDVKGVVVDFGSAGSSFGDRTQSPDSDKHAESRANTREETISYDDNGVTMNRSTRVLTQKCQKSLYPKDYVIYAEIPAGAIVLPLTVDGTKITAPVLQVGAKIMAIKQNPAVKTFCQNSLENLKKGLDSHANEEYAFGLSSAHADVIGGMKSLFKMAGQNDRFPNDEGSGILTKDQIDTLCLYYLNADRVKALQDLVKSKCQGAGGTSDACKAAIKKAADSGLMYLPVEFKKPSGAGKANCKFRQMSHNEIIVQPTSEKSGEFAMVQAIKKSTNVYGSLYAKPGEKEEEVSLFPVSFSRSERDMRYILLSYGYNITWQKYKHPDLMGVVNGIKPNDLGNWWTKDMFAFINNTAENFIGNLARSSALKLLGSLGKLNLRPNALFAPYGATRKTPVPVKCSCGGQLEKVTWRSGIPPIPHKIKYDDPTWGSALTCYADFGFVKLGSPDSPATSSKGRGRAYNLTFSYSTRALSGMPGDILFSDKISIYEMAYIAGRLLPEDEHFLFDAQYKQYTRKGILTDAQLQEYRNYYTNANHILEYMVENPPYFVQISPMKLLADAGLSFPPGTQCITDLIDSGLAGSTAGIHVFSFFDPRASLSGLRLGSYLPSASLQQVNNPSRNPPNVPKVALTNEIVTAYAFYNWLPVVFVLDIKSVDPGSGHVDAKLEEKILYDQYPDVNIYKIKPIQMEDL